MAKTSEPRFLKRRVRAGDIDVHPTDCALVVHYDVEAIVTGANGEEIMAEANHCQKCIRVPALSAKTNVMALAVDVIKKCKYIHESKQTEVEQLLLFLQQRNKTAPRTHGRDDRRKIMDDRFMYNGRTAKLAELESYREMLYDEVDKGALEGAGLILQLARTPDNLEELASNEALMEALTRLLREEGQKSVELATSILSIFFFFSSFTQFHLLLAKYKIGSNCMALVEQENRRYQLWEQAMDKRARRVRAGKMTTEEFEAAANKVNDQEFAQEQLLYVAFHLLLNLAEDPAVEQKMVKKGIVQQLGTMLKRHNFEFLTLVVKFLKKLSIFQENIEVMATMDMMPALANFVPHENSELQSVTIKLLLNLSFHPTLRKRMVNVGLVPKLTELLRAEKPDWPLLMKVLYNLSTDVQNLPCFAEAGTTQLAMKYLMTAVGHQGPHMEPAALAVNLAQDSRCAVIMCKGKGLKVLLTKAIKGRDPILLKLVRTLAQHKETQDLLLDFIDPLASEVHRCHEADDTDMLVELVGILGCLDIDGFDFRQLVEEYKLLNFIKKQLRPGATEDDMVLEVVILVGTVLTDPDCAPLVASSGIVQLMIDLLKAKQEDDEIVLQIIYVWNKLLYYESTRKLVLAQDQAVSYLLDLMHDQNDAIRAVCNSALDIIAECCEPWARDIRMKQFEFHNNVWKNKVLNTSDAPQDMTAEAPMYDYGYGGYVDGGRLADLDDMVNIDEQDGDDYVFGLGDHENNSDDDDDELNRGGRNGPSPKFDRRDTETSDGLYA